MKILAGCPVHDRAWIIDRWAAHLVEAAEVAGVDLELVLLGDPADPTFAAVGHPAHRIDVDEPRPTSVRHWSPLEIVDGQTRVERMVDLRNRLLQEVRLIGPDLFLSIDSDILLHRDALANMIETVDVRGWPAVGGYTFMSPPDPRPHVPSQRCYGSYAHIISANVFDRRGIEGSVIPCDVIMAIKLMTPTAYHVDYQWDEQGEDFGWCRALRRLGHQVGIDGRVASKHVMENWQLDHIDDRVGF